jgi:hypothetical protein
MPKKKRPPKSRLREKAARGPQLYHARYEKIISRYREEVAELRGEPARSHRFSVLLAELFSDLEVPPITDYLAGLEKKISATEAAKCRISRGQPDALFGNVVLEFEAEFPRKLKEAKKQLQKYVAILRHDSRTRDTYFTPIATDGLSFRVFAPEEGEAIPIEEEFLHATLLSTDLLPFGHLDFRPVVLPLTEDEHGYQMIPLDRARREGFLRLAAWVERAQDTWVRKRREKAERMDIYQRLNLHNGLTGQNPNGKYLVLYPMSGTYLCAATVMGGPQELRIGQATIKLKNVVADYKTFVFATREEREAFYLSAVLNSSVIDGLVKPMQSRGLWGPRDICKKVLELPIPEFTTTNRNHSRLAQIAQRSAERVREMVPELKASFAETRGPHAIGPARSAVRQALKQELAEIDSIVREILK